MQTSRTVVLALALFFLFACPAKQDGALEGTVVPPNSGAKITVMQAGKSLSSLDVNTPDGKFRMALAPGLYDVSVTSSSSPFPMNFPAVIIEPGKTTTLPLIEFTLSPGAAILTGVISPGAAGTRVSLLYEGKERAAINTGPEGKYEFMSLPGGKYTVKADSPGYANDAVDVTVSGDQKAAQNMRLIYITSIDGVDWAADKIRAKGKGLPPATKGNPTIMHEMAKRAALADAQRNLLKILEQIKVDPSRDIKTYLGEKKYSEKIQGFVQGYSIAAERDLGNGAVEVELEFPLTGPGGLSRYLAD